MADFGNSIGGLLQGFNSTYFPGIRANEAEARAQQELALRAKADERAAALQQFQLQKYAESEAKDRQAAGLYAGMLGIKPTMTDEDKLNSMDASAPGTIFKPGSNDYVDALTKANPQYEQFMAGGAKAGADMVKQTREGELAKLKMQSDAWKEQNAARLADLRDKQIMAMIAKGQGGGKGKPVLFMDEQNRPFYINTGDPIPPGTRPYDKKAEGQAAKAEQANQDKLMSANLVLEDIGRAKVLADKPLAVGFGAESISNIAGTPAGDLSKMLEGIKANIGFDKLQAMRAASPTGGALGQVSDFENRMLQATLGSLMQSQSPKQFKETLGRLENQYQDIIHGKGNRPGQVQQSTQPAQRTFKWNGALGRVE
jgi:hypothetical protein